MNVRILHLIASNFLGGPEKQILHHAKEMAGTRYRVEVASFQDSSTKPEVLIAATRMRLHATCLPGGISLAALTALEDELRDRKFDLLCTHGYKSNILGHLATRKTKIAHIAFVRGWTAETWRVALYEQIARRVLRSVPTVVCVSRKQAEQLSRHKNRSAPIVVPNAILPPYDGPTIDFSSSENRPKFPADAFVFGSVGRLSAEKGHRYLLEAFAQLSSSVPAAQLRLVLLGAGRELPLLEARAHKLGIADKVVFPGFQRDCSAWMQSMHCLVQPSLTEGTPNSVLEAIHHRLPIVATAVGGVPDVIIDQQNGLLVPPRSADALAAAMREVFQSAELRERFAAGTDHVMNEYSPAVQRERLIAVYKAALQTTRTRGVGKEVELDAA